MIGQRFFTGISNAIYNSGGAAYSLGSSLYTSSVAGVTSVTRSAYKTTLLTLYGTDTEIGKYLAGKIYKIAPIHIGPLEITSAGIMGTKDYLDLILHISENTEHLDELLQASIDNGFDINRFKDDIYYNNEDGTEVSYKTSPLISLLYYQEVVGTIEKIKILIKHGMDMNFHDPESPHLNHIFQSLFTQSAENMDDLIGYMIERGFDINRFKDQSSYTNVEGQQIHFRQSPLINLLYNQQAGVIEKIKILIKHGMDMNYQDLESPYHTHIFQSLFTQSAENIDDLISLMIERGFDINRFKDQSSYTKAL